MNAALFQIFLLFVLYKTSREPSLICRKWHFRQVKSILVEVLGFRTSLFRGNVNIIEPPTTAQIVNPYYITRQFRDVTPLSASLFHPLHTGYVIVPSRPWGLRDPQGLAGTITCPIYALAGLLILVFLFIIYRPLPLSLPIYLAP